MTPPLLGPAMRCLSRAALTSVKKAVSASLASSMVGNGSAQRR